MRTNSIPVLVDTSPHKDVEMLILAARKGFLTELIALRVAPTMRLGNSGSRVYRVQADLDGSLPSRYFYAKVGPKTRLLDEDHAYKVHIDKKIANVPNAWCVENRKEACLCYGAVGSDHSEVTPLSDYLMGSMEVPADKICRAIEGTYANLSPFQKASSEGEIQWFENYKWYLRWERTLDFLEKWLGKADCRRRSLSWGGRTLVSPLLKIRQLAAEKIQAKVRLRPVHGDLHQKNIILEKIGEELNPWVIDFGWTRVFHNLVDYALLEASLKLFHFAPFFSEERFLSLHDFLQDESATPKLRFSSQEAACLKLITLIRRKARREILSPLAWPEEYYLSSLLVSMGLLCIPTCSRRMGWLASSWFASHLGS